MSRCPHCPVEPGVDCPSERFKIYCRWAEGGLAAHVNLIVARSKTDWRAAESAPIPQDGPAPPARAEPPLDPREAAAIREVMVCPWRECHSGCLGTLCHWVPRGQKPRRVRIDACLRCLADR